ncbi:UDP-forming cellulose synthase catalytic subunit [Pseudomonas sp. IC_126]|uniref:UDP-forming cellulose synthase catalytic subunit n=1 Tax=Pseudomonas sp. IC_126 TaxID=2547400 RepID=UPI00103CCBD1|nr:UDP-forming cellulose synthase catalytic subunit [Pseudomonas sp. IC_126]TCD22593.1 UDP-forming cellulose synthase catalytic subunit [Pseudomonas sp. IC_126]
MSHEIGLARQVLANLVLCCSLAALGLVVVVPMALEMQALLMVTTIGAALVLGRMRSRLMTLVMIVISVTVSLRYMYWRTTETLVFGNGLETFLGFGLYLAEIYTLVILILGYIQTAWPLERRIAPLPEDVSLWPTVDVYIPTYNESLSVVQDTVLAAQNLAYPRDKLSIYILDDGKRPEFGAFAAAAGVGYIARSDNNHAKAGNLNHAMAKTHGELICIFDCDHVATQIFLQATVGAFLDDPKLALIQTPHHFYSPDPFERNLSAGRKVPNEGELFYGPVQKGNDFWNATFFCGSCAVIRRRALEDTNGFAVETVTEDAHTALKLQRKGWNTAFLGIPLAAGLATERLVLHVGQRIRWARGMTQIMRLDNPLLGRGLSLPQRLCYLNAMLHFQFALPRIVFLTAPLAYLLLDQNIIFSSAAAIFVYALPHLAVAIITNTRIQGKHRYTFWGEIYETVLCFHIALPTLVTLFSPKRGKFNVTDKGDLLDKDYFDARIVRPHIIVAAVLLLGIALGCVRYFWLATIAPNPYVLALNIAWALFSLVLLFAAIAVAHEKRQVRETIRIDIKLPVVLHLDNGRTLQTTTEDISMGGMRLALPTEEMLTEVVEYAEITYGERSQIFEVKVSGAEPGILRLNFQAPGIAQRRELVRIIMGRADAWLPLESPGRDRPLRSLLLVVRTAISPLLRRRKKYASGESAKPLERAVSNAAAMVLVAVFTAASVIAPNTTLAQVSPLPDLPAPQAETVELPVPVFSVPTRVETLTFGKLGFASDPSIRGMRGELNVPFSVSQQDLVTEARLKLTMSHSDRLLPETSDLEVLLNGELIQRVALTPDTASGQSLEVPLDPMMMLPYNRLIFRLRAHYSDQCENPFNPALWATLSRSSAIELVTQPLPMVNDLAALPQPFFDPASQGIVTLPFIFGAEPNAAMAESAAAVASYFGAQAGYRSARFPVHYDELPTTNAILIATAGALPDGIELPVIEGPTLAVIDNPRQPLSKLLLVLGRDANELKVAVDVLTLQSQGLTGDRARVQARPVAPRVPFDAPAWLRTDEPVPLAQLTEEGALTSTSLMPGQMTIDFRAAPDTFVWRNGNIPLRLHYRFPEGEWFDASKSRLDIALNDNYLTSLPVLKPGLFEKAKQRLGYPSRLEEIVVPIPAYLIYGQNRLDFYFNLDYGDTSECGSSLPDAAYSAIEGDSTIDLSKTYHFAQLPNLSFFVGAGFPFTRMADLSETLAILPKSPAESELQALLELAGRFGNASGYPARGLRVQLGSQLSDTMKGKDLLVVGQIGARLEVDPLLAKSAFRREDAHLRVREQSPLERAITLAKGDWGRETDAADRTLSGYQNFQGLLSAASPVDDTRIMVMLLASRQEWLPDAVQRLENAQLNTDIRGDLAVFESNNRVMSYRVGQQLTYGTLPLNKYARWLFSERPFLLMFMLLIAAAVAAACLYPLLRARAARREQS